MSFCGLHFFDSIDQRDAIILKQSMELVPNNTLSAACFSSPSLLEVQLMVVFDFNEFNGHSIREGSWVPNAWSAPGASGCSTNICWTNKWINTSNLFVFSLPTLSIQFWAFLELRSMPLKYCFSWTFLSPGQRLRERLLSDRHEQVCHLISRRCSQCRTTALYTWTFRTRPRLLPLGALLHGILGAAFLAWSSIPPDGLPPSSGQCSWHSLPCGEPKASWPRWLMVRPVFD